MILLDEPPPGAESQVVPVMARELRTLLITIRAAHGHDVRSTCDNWWRTTVTNGQPRHSRLSPTPYPSKSIQTRC
jgi:hypothetical protein